MQIRIWGGWYNAGNNKRMRTCRQAVKTGKQKSTNNQHYENIYPKLRK